MFMCVLFVFISVYELRSWCSLIDFCLIRFVRVADCFIYYCLYVLGIFLLFLFVQNFFLVCYLCFLFCLVRVLRALYTCLVRFKCISNLFCCWVFFNRCYWLFMGFVSVFYWFICFLFVLYLFLFGFAFVVLVILLFLFVLFVLYTLF